MVQRVTHLETQTDAKRKRFEHYDTAITEILHEVYTQEYFSAPSSDKPTMEMWKDLADGNEDYQNWFSRVFDNTDVKEDDDKFTPDSYDNYINMEIALDQGEEQPEYARVKKQLKDNQGRPIGIESENTIINTRMYEVKYQDVHTVALAANIIAENIFSQVDEEGNHSVLFDEIVDVRKYGTHVLQQDAFVTTSSGTQRRFTTTKFWEVNLKWKDINTSWNKLKDIKDSHPVQLAEYAVENRISE